MKKSRRAWKLGLQTSATCLALCGCGNRAEPGNADAQSSSSQAKIYAMDDVDKELKEDQVAPGGT
jgi:hypothetical protein